MTEPPRHSVSVAGVVVNHKGDILAIRRRDNGEWQPPGGILETEETIEDGVRREVLEETGISVTVHHVTGVYKNMSREVVALVLLCSPISGSIRTTSETAEVTWMTPEEATKLMSPVFAVRIDDAVRQLGRAYQRSHDGAVIFPHDPHPPNIDSGQRIVADASMLARIIDTITEISHITSELEAPEAETAIAKMYSAAALVRSVALLRSAVALIDAGQPEAVGVVCRTAWETWLVGYFIIMGGQQSLIRLAADSLRNKSTIADRNNLGLGIESLIQRDREELESAERSRLKGLGTPHPEGTPIKFNRLTIESMATEIDRHLTRLDPSEEGSVLRSYNLLYRSHSTFDNHGLSTFERFIHQNVSGRLSISPDSKGWISPLHSLGIATLHVSQLALKLSSEFEFDAKGIEAAQDSLIESLRAIGNSAVGMAQESGLPGDWQRFK